MPSHPPSPNLGPHSLRPARSRVGPGRQIGLAAAALCFAVLLGCGGGGGSGTNSLPVTVSPASALIASGETIRFQATPLTPGETVWTVTPASAGTIASDGTFHPSGTPCSCTVRAAWSLNPGSSGTATLTILGAPQPSAACYDRVEASGLAQTSPTGSIQNSPIIGEIITTSTGSADGGGIQVRNGFDPPVAPAP